MNKFLTPSERAAGMTADTVRREALGSNYRSTSRGETVPVMEDSLRPNPSGRRAESRRQSESAVPEKLSEAQASSVAIPNTPASLIPQQKPHTWNRDDGGPYKAEMISRMETMKRGERVIPPCDRCRRLHMDCIKNLTACLGCTKKHAKCSWKDVTLDELESTAPAARERAEKEGEGTAPSSSEWDNMLKQTKSEAEPSRESPMSGSTPAAITETVEARPIKSSTPRVSSPTNGVDRAASHSHESPRLDVRPPPLDQQLREAAEPDGNRPYARFSPFQRPPSQSQSQSQAQSQAQSQTQSQAQPQAQSQAQPQTQSPAQPQAQSPGAAQAPYPSQALRPKEESMADEGDRLAAIAGQVYRSASQNAARVNEQAS